MLSFIKRALAFQTVYAVKCYDTDVYLVEAATCEQAKSRLFDVGLDPSNVEYVREAGEVLDGEPVQRL